MCPVQTRKSKRYVDKLSVLFRFVDQVQDQRQNHTDQNAGGNRYVHLEISTVDHNIAWQLSGPRQTRRKVKDESRNDENDSGDDQKFSHLQKY